MEQVYSNQDRSLNVHVILGSLSPGKLLDGRCILITGGASGIGYEIAKQCIEQGARVIITGTNANKLAIACDRLGLNCKSLIFDMKDVRSFDKHVGAAVSMFGYIDCLVNNAGISLHEGDFINVEEEQWDAQFATNLKGPYFLTQSWLRYYRSAGLKYGRIVMMASDTSGMGSSIPYGLTKAGIASLTRGLGKKLVTEGIRVNAVAPGTTLTPMTDDFTHGEIARPTTQGMRVLFPEEIARVCVFLLSDLSTCISGNVIGCSEANICFDNTFLEAETNP